MCIATVIGIVAVLSVARSTALCPASPTLPDHRYHARLLMLRQRAIEEQRAVIERILQIVEENFSAAEHLFLEVYGLTQPLSAASCQHPFPTLVMLLGAMGGMTNGAVVQLWSGGVSLLSAAVLGKKPPDRTHLVHRGSRRHIHCAVGAREIEQSQRGWASRSARVHSIGMQSVTLPEFFYRCSPDWPQTEEAQMLHHRDIPSRAWRSMILNINEGYEFLGALSVSAGGAGSKDTGPMHICVNA